MEEPIVKKTRMERFILWREQHIKERHFVLILSFIVGISCALAGLVEGSTVASR